MLDILSDKMSDKMSTYVHYVDVRSAFDNGFVVVVVIVVVVVVVVVVSTYVNVRRRMTYVDVRQRTWTYVDVCPLRGRTWTYMDVHRPTSTYVDVGQRMSTTWSAGGAAKSVHFLIKTHFFSLFFLIFSRKGDQIGV